MKAHKFADIFPMMSSKEFGELKKDIKENGLIDPIITYEEKILDGRNRYKACEDVGVKPRFKNFDGEDALQHVMSTNLKRRYLTDSQKVIVGIRYKKSYNLQNPQGSRTDLTSSTSGRSRLKASEQVGVSGSYIDMGEAVIKAKPEMEEKIMSGEIKVKTAFREIQIEKQEEEIKNVKSVKGEYDVIVIDPPWPYEEKYDPDGRRGACPYPLMSIPEISKIRLPAKDNSVLWLWTTHRFIWDAKKLMEDWGFEYKAILTWDKEKMGLGVWLRMQSEFCLVGIKGKPLWKLKDQRDILREPRTTHSTKPESFYNLVDSICGDVRKLDYFNNGRIRKGWDSYGI